MVQSTGQGDSGEATRTANSALLRASSTYRRQAWIAMAALLAFVAFYISLATWFGWKAYKLAAAAAHGASEPVWLLVAGACSLFLAVFMFKALFFIKRGSTGRQTEIRQSEQPALFAFLYALADEARAPRPHKVFITERVNAAVFYDLSPLNLIFPSRKNLEIGLALVNVLTVSEFRAVLAHEFGHFAQKSMAVGRWVYVAQQIAAHIVAKRDGLDKFLASLSSFDLRIAWVGWLLSLAVWSIRSVVDTFFRAVLLAERALSREMEFQADRVAVSLTGSDALIHALYKCRPADMAWDRTLAFSNGQLEKGQRTADLFDIQTRIIGHLGEILGDPSFAAPPAPKPDSAPSHRVFMRDGVQVSRMWATHPLNHEREENAKRIYLAADLNNESAWSLFDAPADLRARVSSSLFSGISPEPEVVSVEMSDTQLKALYVRESYEARYRGAYLARSVTRRAQKVPDLFDAGMAHDQQQSMYPASIADDLKQLDLTMDERATLQAVLDGHVRAQDSAIKHRGGVVSRRELPSIIAGLDAEIAAIEDRLASHDHLCRSVAYGLAVKQGQGWDSYWLGLLGMLHYTEHVQADIADARGALANVVSVVTAKRKASEKEVQRILMATGPLYSLLSSVDAQRGALVPDAQTMALLEKPDWSAVLGEWTLGPASRENIGSWLDVIDGWTGQFTAALSRLHRSALDQLLITERMLVDMAAARVAPQPAPQPALVPQTYDAFLPGSERPRQKKLDMWSRFQVADGWAAGGARLAVAGGIIGGLMGMSATLGTATVTAFNGLDRPVSLRIDGTSVDLAPHASRSVSVNADGRLSISAKTSEGKLIESFDVDSDVISARYVYNVASAASLYQWTATYGPASPSPDQDLGNPRWLQAQADFILEPPPQQISSKSGGATRQVLSASESASIRANVSSKMDAASAQAIVLAHARWDPPGSPYLAEWLGEASTLPGFEQLLKARLADQPKDIAALRVMQDLPDPAAHSAACDLAVKTAGTSPDVGDFQYLVTRCMADGPQRDAAFQAGFARFPDSGWYGYAAGNTYMQHERWPEATRALTTALKVPPLADQAALQLARVRRISEGKLAQLRDLQDKSETLRMEAAIEAGEKLPVPSAAAFYAALYRGDLPKARQNIVPAGKQSARLVRLMGASDGAPQDLVQQSLNLSANEGLDPVTVWSAMGLAIRNNRSIEPFMEVTKALTPEQSRALVAFVDMVKTGKDLSRAEQIVAGLPVEFKAQIYCMGTVAMGSKAPFVWREFARRALFPTERPYLG